MNPSRSLLFRSITTFGLLASLSACTAPDLGARPEMRTPASITADRSFASDGASAWPADGWWSAYGDAQLATLIEEGLRSSPDFAAATARFRIAQGMAQAAGAALLPSVGANGTVLYEKQSRIRGIPPQFVPGGWQDVGQASLNLNFDLDLWGRNRAALAAATSQTEAALIEQNQAELMLTTAIAQSYADLARLYAERDVLAASVDVRSATQKLVSNRVTNGLDTRAELKQADAALPTARAELAATDELIGLKRNQIAALIGAGPDRGLAIARPALAGLRQPGLPAGVTTNLIGRRPDIVAARARAEAAANRIKVARADFYPAISLGAMIGRQSLGVENLDKRAATFGSVGPAISLPLFDGGLRKGNYRQARATYDEAVADYDRTVLQAYREVADALTGQRAVAERLVQSREALVASEEAYAVARKRYEGGLSTYLDVLTSEERLLQARRSVANLGALGFSADIGLVRALGGGFTTNTAPITKDNVNG